MKKITNIILMSTLLLAFIVCMIGCDNTSYTSYSNDDSSNSNSFKTIRLYPGDKKMYSDEDGDKYIIHFYSNYDDFTAGSFEIEGLYKDGPSHVVIVGNVYCRECGDKHEIDGSVGDCQLDCERPYSFTCNEHGGAINNAWIKITRIKDN